MTKTYYLTQLQQIAREYWQDKDDEFNVFPVLKRTKICESNIGISSGNRLRDSSQKSLRELYLTMETLVTKAMKHGTKTPSGVVTKIRTLPAEVVNPILQIDDTVLRKYLPLDIYLALLSRKRT